MNRKSLLFISKNSQVLTFSLLREFSRYLDIDDESDVYQLVGDEISQVDISDIITQFIRDKGMSVTPGTEVTLYIYINYKEGAGSDGYPESDNCRLSSLIQEQILLLSNHVTLFLISSVYDFSKLICGLQSHTVLQPPTPSANVISLEMTNLSNSEDILVTLLLVFIKNVSNLENLSLIRVFDQLLIETNNIYLDAPIIRVSHEDLFEKCLF
jgi:hypothetical protein